MRWKTVALGDVCDVVAGGTPKRSSPQYWGGGIPWVKISDMLQGLITSTDETITATGLENSAAKLLPAGTLLISIFATIGRTAVLGCDAATNQAIVGVIPRASSTLDKQFLLHCLNYSVGTLEKLARGVAQANINGSVLKALQVPVPPLSEQKRIAAILDAADALRAKRRESIEQLDSLVQATFLEMFGDPATNPKGWRHDSLGNHGALKNGLNFSSSENGNELPCLGVGDFKSRWCVSDLADLSTVNLNVAPSAEYLLQDGDLVFVRSNGNRALVGRCVVVYPGERSVTFSGFCIRFRSESEELAPIYLAHLFQSQSMKSAMLGVGKGANIQNINQKVLNSLPIPKPPQGLQQHFASIIESIEQQKARLTAHLAELDSLFASLQSRAFNAELVA
jgi:type I restriction enzyme S subunit